MKETFKLEEIEEENQENIVQDIFNYVLSFYHLERLHLKISDLQGS